MQDKLVYLESDEEITSVIDKISRVSGDEVALVIPRGGNLAQSIVNLKLLKKRAADLGKEVALVTTDKISRNLASQVGISVYSRIEEISHKKITPAPVVEPSEPISNTETIKSSVPPPEVKKPAEDLPELPGIRINRYYDQKANVVNRPKPEENPPSATAFGGVPQDAGETVIELPPPKQEELAPKEPAVEKKDEPVIKPEPEPELEPTELKGKEVIRRSEFARKDMTIGQAQEEVERKHQADKEKSRSEDIEKEHKARLPGRRFKPLKKRRAIIVLISLAVLAVLAVGYIILPQAKATITFKAENFQESVEVTINKNVTKIDSKELSIPATQSKVEKEISDKFAASGKKNIGNKASGEITFYNGIDLTADKIPSGSQLTANSKNFVTDGDITIPAVTVVSVIPPAFNPGTVKGKVVAVAAGEDSNLPANTKFTITALSGSKRDNIYGQSTTALTGGSTQEVAVVTDGDIAAAQEKIKNRLISESKDEVLKKVPAAEKFVEGTIDQKISDLTSSVPANTQASDFTFKGKIQTTVLSFKENDFKDMLIPRFESKLPKNRVLVQRDKISLDYQVVSKDSLMESAVYKVTLNGKISSKIDTESLRDQLRGKTSQDAKAILDKLDMVKSVDIVMQPNLKIYKTLPLLKRSIKIETVYQVD